MHQGSRGGCELPVARSSAWSQSGCETTGHSGDPSGQDSRCPHWTADRLRPPECYHQPSVPRCPSFSKNSRKSGSRADRLSGVPESLAPPGFCLSVGNRSDPIRLHRAQELRYFRPHSCPPHAPSHAPTMTPPAVALAGLRWPDREPVPRGPLAQSPGTNAACSLRPPGTGSVLTFSALPSSRREPGHRLGQTLTAMSLAHALTQQRMSAQLAVRAAQNPAQYHGHSR